MTLNTRLKWRFVMAASLPLLLSGYAGLSQEAQANPQARRPAAPGRRPAAPAAQKNPAFTEANLLAGRNKYKEAIEKYKVALTVEPKNGRIYQMYARTLALMGLLDEAIEKYRQAITFSGQQADLLSETGVAYTANGTPALGAAYLKRATEVNPKYISAWNNLGVTMEQLGDYQAARAAFQMSLKLQPTNESIQKKLNEVTALLPKSKPFTIPAIGAGSAPPTASQPPVSTSSPKQPSSASPVTSTATGGQTPAQTVKTPPARAPVDEVQEPAVAGFDKLDKSGQESPAAPPVAVSEPHSPGAIGTESGRPLPDVTTSIQHTTTVVESNETVSERVETVTTITAGGQTASGGGKTNSALSGESSGTAAVVSGNSHETGSGSQPQVQTLPAADGGERSGGAATSAATAQSGKDSAGSSAGTITSAASGSGDTAPSAAIKTGVSAGRVSTPSAEVRQQSVDAGQALSGAATTGPVSADGKDESGPVESSGADDTGTESRTDSAFEDGGQD